ncbi:hypothetical protein ACU4GA_16630 [Methylobacterium oryzae CBMB20]
MRLTAPRLAAEERVFAWATILDVLPGVRPLRGRTLRPAGRSSTSR